MNQYPAWRKTIMVDEIRKDKKKNESVPSMEKNDNGGRNPKGKAKNPSKGASPPAVSMQGGPSQKGGKSGKTAPTLTKGSMAAGCAKSGKNQEKNMRRVPPGKAAGDDSAIGRKKEIKESGIKDGEKDKKFLSSQPPVPKLKVKGPKKIPKQPVSRAKGVIKKTKSGLHKTKGGKKNEKKKKKKKKKDDDDDDVALPLLKGHDFSQLSWRQLTAGWGKQTKQQRIAAWDESTYKGKSRVHRIMHEENLRRAKQGQRLAFLKKEFVSPPTTPAVRGKAKHEYLDSEMGSQGDTKTPADTANIACSVCRSKEYAIKGKNWLIICDKCKQGYHQLCHKPKIREIGPESEEWYCATCTLALMKKRNLGQFKIDDVVWYKHRKWPYWPGKISKIDFIRRADPRPIQVAFYPSLTTKKWAYPHTMKTWAEGMKGHQLRMTNLTAERKKEMSSAFEIADAKAKSKRRYFEM